MAGVTLGAGVGLGLAIASRYAALMGGTLELEASPSGRGVRAVLELCEAPAPDAATADRRSAPAQVAVH
jgi:signal transduction histidine kinase